MACRKDGKGRVLRKGEGYRKGDGRYSYVYIDPLGKKRTIYAKSLVRLREREEQLQKDQLDGLDIYVAGKADVNFLFDRYISTKTELRSTTYSNYLYTWAGPEIAVATTKAYSSQLIALYLLAMKFAHARGTLDDAGLKEMLEDLQKLPEQVELLLNNKNKIQKFANRYLAAKDVFFIGRGIDYAISMEGSLKLKEISYIHSEAYAAGELKHGTISLIEEGTLVAAVLTQEDLYKKMISNMEEVRTRGAFVMAVTNEGNTDVERVADYVIYIPETNRYFANSLAIIPLQLFGYYVSVGRGCDVDKPRNLAKSVTVE